MSTRTHGSLVTAINSKVGSAPVPLQDATADAILSFKRELREVAVEGLGRVYVYEPQSVAEKDAYHVHMRMTATGLQISLRGVVDGVLARVRNKAGALLFSSADRDRLLALPADRLMTIWNAIGADGGPRLSAEAVADAEKK